MFESAFREYAAEWAFKHPQPWDFFNLVERRAGRDLDWFWIPAFAETATLDQAVATVRVLDGRTEIHLVIEGGMVVPTPVRVTLAGPWRSGR